MYEETLELANALTEKKKRLMKQRPLRYLLAAGLAGAYVGLGIALIVSVGAPLYAAHSPYTSTLMGVSFGVALTLVLFAGAELFTGNHLLFTISSLSGRTAWRDTLASWGLSYVGNLLGALALCGLLVGAGIFAQAGPDHLLMATAVKKMHLTTAQLFFRGILCNWLVCLAVWTGLRVKSEAARLVLIWWMLYAFIATGYEHSVANMTVLSLALLLPHPATVTLGGWLHNMVPVTLGNIVGGALFVGTAYWLISPVRSARKPSAAGEGERAERIAEPQTAEQTPAAVGESAEGIAATTAALALVAAPAAAGPRSSAQGRTATGEPETAGSTHGRTATGEPKTADSTHGRTATGEPGTDSSPHTAG
ncbi:formate/nitrite transporter family protein [Paenibacillus athensensis]|uniref:Nitrite transporter NirC n=1 Tax=Paenibacillus athensensis TaxID=1967502 RepID=A0A4Y8PSK9_9BACL|nr:formate/nitrite transporter family protein [Paenibacillus athensensis]